MGRGPMSSSDLSCMTTSRLGLHEEVQEHCCNFDPTLRPLCHNAPAHKAHVTLLVANVKDIKTNEAKGIAFALITSLIPLASAPSIDTCGGVNFFPALPLLSAVRLGCLSCWIKPRAVPTNRRIRSSRLIRFKTSGCTER